MAASRVEKSYKSGGPFEVRFFYEDELLVLS